VRVAKASVRERRVDPRAVVGRRAPELVGFLLLLFGS
jgi:hypothetical protein